MLQADLVEPHVPSARVVPPLGGPGRVSRLAALLLGVALTAASGPTAGHSSAGVSLGSVHESAPAVDDGAGSAAEVPYGDEDCEHGHESNSCPQCPSCSGALPLAFTAGLGPMRPGDHPVYRIPFSEVALEGIPRPPRNP